MKWWYNVDPSRFHPPTSQHANNRKPYIWIKGEWKRKQRKCMKGVTKMRLRKGEERGSEGKGYWGPRAAFLTRREGSRVPWGRTVLASSFPGSHSSGSPALLLLPLTGACGEGSPWMGLPTMTNTSPGLRHLLWYSPTTISMPSSSDFLPGVLPGPFSGLVPHLGGQHVTGSPKATGYNGVHLLTGLVLFAARLYMRANLDILWCRM